MTTKNAILLKTRYLNIHCSKEIVSCKLAPDSIKCEAGTLLKIHESFAENDKIFTVEIKDYKVLNHMFQNLYECSKLELRFIDDSLWPFLINIENLNDRLMLAQNETLCQEILKLKANDIIILLVKSSGKKEVHIVCKIRKICCLEKLCSEGLFFFLEALEPPNVAYIYDDEIYVLKESGIETLIATANRIKPFSNTFGENKKVFERLKDFVTHSCSLANSSMTNGMKDKIPTAKFYDYTDSQKVTSNIEFSKNLELCKEGLNVKIKPKNDALKDNQNVNISQATILPKPSTETNIKVVHYESEELDVNAESNALDIIDVLKSGGWPSTMPNSQLLNGDSSTDISKQIIPKVKNIVNRNGFIAANASEIANQYTKVYHETPLYDNIINKKNDTTNYIAPLETTPTKANEEKFEEDIYSIPDTDLKIYSSVTVFHPLISESLNGVILWIGKLNGDLKVGVKFQKDNKIIDLYRKNGRIKEEEIFRSEGKQGLFVNPEWCSLQKLDVKKELTKGTSDRKDFVPIKGSVAPIRINNLRALEKFCGDFKGIQGVNNSCYLDATLFSMFMFTSLFDTLLFRSPDSNDIPRYEEIQAVLREEIVYPLRKNSFASADRVMKLRELLDKCSTVNGLTSEEKDPEEFLNSLLAQIFRVEPYLKLSSGQESFFYQLFIEKNDNLSFPSVQQLFEQSIFSSNIKLKEVPPCLIIQMPRFGKDYKMYSRILPSQVLDITDIIEDAPRQCGLCLELAYFECVECFTNVTTPQNTPTIDSYAFCNICCQRFHSHDKRKHHKPQQLKFPSYFKGENTSELPRIFMELIAVVCIERSHYVSFAKTGPGSEAPWCFFDSMADREGEQNIPRILPVEKLTYWLSEEGVQSLAESTENDKMLPTYAKRFFCDAYMCIYQSKDVMMYR